MNAVPSTVDLHLAPGRADAAQQVVRSQFTVGLQQGLHAQPAAVFVKTVHPFDADITVIAEDGTNANGKSILSILMLGAGTGTRLTIVARGPDADEAMQSVQALFLSNFEESGAVARARSLAMSSA